MSDRVPRQTLPGATAVALLFVILTWPVIFSGRGGPSEASDQVQYHEPVIQTFSEQWPRVDFVNYQSATSPGYHLFLAVIHRYFSDNRTVLQLISSLFSLALVLVVYHFTARRVGGGKAFAMLLPFMASSYILGSAIWLTTDNAAWLFVVLALGGCAMMPPTASRIVKAGVYTTLAVCIRQIHVWTVVPVFLSSIRRTRRDGTSPPLILLAVVSCVLPLLVLAYLVWMWGGLMPPKYVDLHARGFNFAIIPLTLALAGVFGIFYLPAAGRMTLDDVLKDRIIWVAVALAILICVVVPTSYDADAGRRFGLLWRVVEFAPDIAGRSVVFPPLALLGVIVLLQLWRAAADTGHTSSATLLLIAAAAWLVAQSANSQAWQRYAEPFVLILLAWLAALATSRGHSRFNRPTSRRWWIGPLVLGLIQLALSGYTVYWPALQWSPPPQ